MKHPPRKTRSKHSFVQTVLQTSSSILWRNRRRALADTNAIPTISEIRPLVTPAESLFRGVSLGNPDYSNSAAPPTLPNATPCKPCFSDVGTYFRRWLVPIG